MILSIRKYGDDVLRHRAEPVAEIDAPLQSDTLAELRSFPEVIYARQIKL